MPVLRTVIQDTHQKLEAAGIPDARLEAEVLVMNVMRMARQNIFGEQDTEVSEQQQTALDELLERRYNREPLAYLLGQREFYGINVILTPAVLIPRPETEILVDVALQYLPDGGRALDLCCGSGAIALSLAQEAVTAQVVAADISEAALKVAKANSVSHELQERVEWFCGDFFAPLAGVASFDIVVCNPPYVRHGDLACLEPEVQDHEPHLALDGGEDGLDCYRRIVQEAPGFISPRGYLLMEVGEGQITAVEALLAQVASFSEVQTKPDLNGVPRVIVARISSS